MALILAAAPVLAEAQTVPIEERGINALVSASSVALVTAYRERIARTAPAGHRNTPLPSMLASIPNQHLESDQNGLRNPPPIQISNNRF